MKQLTKKQYDDLDKRIYEACLPDILTHTQRLAQ